MADAAIIFDVDGVLLELTRAEEDLFFQPFATRCDTEKLSRDWNSYEIRNDENIVAELVERHALPATDNIKIRDEYLALLQVQLSGNHIASPSIEGAAELLHRFAAQAKLGIATANFREAARLRLEHSGLWHHVEKHAFGADGGGHKHQILGRALSSITLPKSRIVYIGDNLNDVEAGLTHGVHFIGFSTSPNRLKALKQAGAKHVSSNHTTTANLIKTLLHL